MEIDSRFTEAFDSFDGRGRLSLASFQAGANGLAAVNSNLTFKERRPRSSVASTSRRGRRGWPQILAGRTRFDGRYRLDVGAAPGPCSATMPPMSRACLSLMAGLNGPSRSPRNAACAVAKVLSAALGNAGRRFDVAGRCGWSIGAAVAACASKLPMCVGQAARVAVSVATASLIIGRASPAHRRQYRDRWRRLAQRSDRAPPAAIGRAAERHRRHRALCRRRCAPDPGHGPLCRRARWLDPRQHRRLARRTHFRWARDRPPPADRWPVRRGWRVALRRGMYRRSLRPPDAGVVAARTDPPAALRHHRCDSQRSAGGKFGIGVASRNVRLRGSLANRPLRSMLTRGVSSTARIRPARWRCAWASPTAQS